METFYLFPITSGLVCFFRPRLHSFHFCYIKKKLLGLYVFYDHELFSLNVFLYNGVDMKQQNKNN